MRQTLISTAIAAVLGLSAAAQAATVPVLINPDAGGADPTINVGSLDWNVGNSIAVADPGKNVNNLTATDQFTVFAHAALQGFNNAGGSPIGGLSLNSAYEWTFVSKFRETLDAIVGPTTYQSINDPNAVFQIWVSPVDSDSLKGNNFQNGTMILSASQAVGNGFFTATTPNPLTSLCGAGQTPDASGVCTAVLDGFGANDYAGYITEVGQGSTTITGTVDTIDSNYFPGLKTGDAITLQFTTQQNLNYQQQNPSSCFWDPAGAYFVGAGNGIAGAPCTSAVGDGGTIGVFGFTQGTGTGVFGYAGAIPPGGIPVPGNVGVMAKAAAAGTALWVDGRTRFSRSGRSAVSSGKTYKDVPVPGGVSSASQIIATATKYVSGTYVQAAVYRSSTVIRVYLNKKATTTVYFAWIVLN